MTRWFATACIGVLSLASRQALGQEASSTSREGVVQEAGTPYPDGAAAPPTAAGRKALGQVDGTTLRGGFEIAAAYVYRRGPSSPAQGDWFHVFELSRLHLAAGADGKHANARVLVEGVRSAGEGALTGIAGDSLVLRLREGYAGLRTACKEHELESADGACESTPRVTGSVGFLPTRTAAELDGTAMMTWLARSAVEREGLLAPADVGVSVRGDIGRIVSASLAAHNGEGYGGRELNRGKNVEAALGLRPLARVPRFAPLFAFGAIQGGSSGVGLARAERLSVLLAWQGAFVRAGAAFTHALGVGDDGARKASALDVFGRAQLPVGLTFGGRAAHVARDARVSGDFLFSLVAFIGWRVSAFEVDVALDQQWPGSVTKTAQVGSDRTELRVVGRFVL